MHFNQKEMKAYSLELPQTIVDTYFEDGISQRQLGKRFRVALSFVEKLLKQYRETGSIAPKIRTQQMPTKLNEHQLSLLKQIVEASSDATLDELPSSLEQKTGVLIGRSTIDRMLRLLDISVKKNTACDRKRKRTSSIITVRILANGSRYPS